MTPTRLAGESDKAWAAFQAYVELNGSTGEVAKKLCCSGQNIRKWAAKHDWRNRYATLCRLECEKRIAAEEKALETTAQISEGRKAKLAFDAFEVAELFMKEAKSVHARHPMAAAKLALSAVEIASAIGGCAKGYSAPGTEPQIAIQFFDGNQPVDAPTLPTNLDELEALAAQLAVPAKELPCSNWSPNDKDASPQIVAEPEPLPTPEPEPEPSQPGVPGRAMATPTSDGRGADGKGVQPTFTRGMVPIFGI
jgi:hypothetical protein